MKHTKGLIILIAIAVISVFFGAKSLYSKLTDKSSFSFHFSTGNDADDDFEEEFIDEFEDSFTNGGTIGKIINLTQRKNSEVDPKATKKPYISVIHIRGVISEENKTYNQKWLLKQIKRAKNDPNNRGILLNINSPGGTVYESDEAYLSLLEFKESTKRPVYAYFGSLAASGGYYIGCAADTIDANRNCLTGSIGVIAGQALDATALLDKLGVKITTITAGRNKNMGNYNSSLTEEQRAILQSIADEAYEQFTEIVADSRNLDLSNVKALADGRVYTAKQAKSHGLVDDVCSFDEAKDLIKEAFEAKDEEGNEGESVNFVEYKYRYEDNWMSLLSGAASLVQNPEAAVYELLGSTSAKCMYLYQ